MDVEEHLGLCEVILSRFEIAVEQIEFAHLVIEGDLRAEFIGFLVFDERLLSECEGFVELAMGEFDIR